MAAKAVKRASRGAGGTARQAKRLRGIAGYVADSQPGDFDRLIYERIRLGIMSALAVSNEMSFAELRDLLETTDGNLSAHARKLEDAGYIACRKSFSGRKPRTDYKLTRRGRKVFTRYLDHMEQLILAARG